MEYRFAAVHQDTASRAGLKESIMNRFPQRARCKMEEIENACVLHSEV